MKYLNTITTFFALAASALQASAQEKPALFPGNAAKDTTAAVTVAADPNEIPQDFLTPVGSFADGAGAACDTIDVGDGRLQIVLRDDHTWYYLKNLESISKDSVFTESWIPNSTNPYDIAISQLPTHMAIALVDSASVFVCPNQTKVFSKFGYRRGRRHQGVDLPLVKGTPVKAAFDGRVRTSTWVSGYGNLVIIRHENGLETFYGHLSERKVDVGDWVHAGDVIGLGGSTGRSTGPHLHFETRYKGYAFDPEWIADYETGKLRSNVFVLRRSYLDPSSRYVSTSLDEEDEIYADDERIAAAEEKLAAEKKAAQAAIKYHTVRQGDTVSAICVKYGTTIKKIKSLNPKLNVDRISLGQKIRVR